MRRPTSRPVSITRRTTGDTATVLVRAKGRDLGAITQLGPESDATLAGTFVHRPAFADAAEAFRAHAAAVQAGDAVEIAARAADVAALGVDVWHTGHDMRIDEPGSLTIAGGRARFRPSGAFLMLRTGGI